MGTAYSEDREILPGVKAHVIELGYTTEPSPTGVNYASIQEFQEAMLKVMGPNVTEWRFRCPKCSNVASGQEFKDAGAPADKVPVDCIGRWVKGKGCDWTAVGLFDICKIHVQVKPGKWMPTFEPVPKEA